MTKIGRSRRYLNAREQRLARTNKPPARCACQRQKRGLLALQQLQNRLRQLVGLCHHGGSSLLKNLGA